ncbi:MAG: TetR/AcrR family transcriptional regulator [Chloroflexi bacterium]|nr:TetR/AcrR family transcriptional regulator [Chloroflexota bacterium]
MAVETTRRRRIEDVASDLFREQGYAATSVRDIARALDIQGASLYAHVTSKEDVLWAIVDRAASRFEAAADAAEERTRPNDHLARLAELARAHVRTITEDVGAASVFVGEWRSLGPQRRSTILERRDAYERRFRDLIAAGISSGELRMTDARLAAMHVLGALNSIATWYDPSGRLPAERIADYTADLAVRTLAEDPT